MNADRDFVAVLESFGLARSTYTAEALANAGGFSGAQLWRVAAGERVLCLRQWPLDCPDETRLRFIHAVLEFAGMQLDIVPRLQRTPATGETAVRYANHLWELTTWLPGVADFRLHPSSARLAAALQALARVHLALELFPTRMTGASTSPGLAERSRRLAELQALLPTLQPKLAQATAELRTRGERIVHYFQTHAATIARQLVQASQVCIPLQPCLRDIWHDHVLFTGDEVTGIIDFDAVRIDTVAGDLSRLLTSLVGDATQQRQAALAAYQSLRALSVEECALIEVFDASSALMSGMNWLVWLLIDERHFPDLNRVYARLDEALASIAQRENIGLWKGA